MRKIFVPAMLAVWVGALGGCAQDGAGSGPPDGGAGGGSDSGSGGDGGWGSDSGSPAPDPTQVTGNFHQICHQLPHDTDVPLDMSPVVIQALLPDGGTTGYHTVVGRGHVDGSFAIPDVPPGTTYLLRIDDGYYLTDQRVIDFRAERVGRCVPRPASPNLPTEVTLDIANMTPYAFGDSLILESLADDSFEVVTPATGDTGLHQSFPWNGFLPDAAWGDDLVIAHTGVNQPSQPGPTFLFKTRVIDMFSSTSTTITGGVATSIHGQFAPVTEDRTLSFTLDRAPLEAAYHGPTLPGAQVLNLVAGPMPAEGIQWDVVSYTSDNAPRTLTDDPYGDPFPAGRRTIDIEYGRIDFIRFPGGDTAQTSIGGGTSQLFDYTGGPVTPPPLLLPPAAIHGNGVDLEGGGKIAFDGQSPITVDWQPSATATSYQLQVYAFVADPQAPPGLGFDLKLQAVFRTTGTSLRLPASVFHDGTFYQFVVNAVQATNNFGAGQFLPPAIPSQTSGVASGRILLSSTCGNGVVDPGETCDTSGASATCNDDCTPAACGDAILNPAAGEECDDGNLFDFDQCSNTCKAQAGRVPQLKAEALAPRPQRPSARSMMR